MWEERRQICKVLLRDFRLACLRLFSFFRSLKRGYVPCPHCHCLRAPRFPCQAEQMPGLLWATWGKSELGGRNRQSLAVFLFCPTCLLKPFLQSLPLPEPLPQPGEWTGHGCAICSAKCCCQSWGRSREEGEGWALLIQGLLLSFPHHPQPHLPLGAAAVAWGGSDSGGEGKQHL